ncbi:hypothetical protein Q5E86_17950 [Providencia sp. CRE-138-0111]|uniref:Uncharacterized protein n=1 Tax=Providencia huashanensis TaxID=3037798 RepID=A0ABT9AX27_9GAMM|nr:MULTISPECIES: hypothetical protein [Providencia]MDO7831698.1 hypothetical protein [Providencia sp. CRE-138-0026]MDO7858187.1 hypothetical protein [Providencia sp. CRE-138-0111]
MRLHFQWWKGGLTAKRPAKRGQKTAFSLRGIFAGLEKGKAVRGGTALRMNPFTNMSEWGLSNARGKSHIECQHWQNAVWLPCVCNFNHNPYK